SVAVPGELTIGADNTSTTFSGLITGFGRILKEGTGTLTLSGTSNFTGTVTINQGTVSGDTIGNHTVPSAFGAGGGFSLNDGALRYTGASGTTGRTFNLLAGGGTVEVTGPDLTIQGEISNVGSLTKTGSGVLVLAETNNSYTGSTTVSGGVLSFGSVAAIGANSPLGRSSLANPFDVEINSGATLRYNGPTVAFDRRITLGAGGGAFDVQHAGTIFPINQPITGAGGLTNTGAGVLRLDATNTYGSVTNVNSGTLRLNISHAIPNTSDVTVAAGATLDVAGFNDSVGSLAGSGLVIVGPTGATGQFTTGLNNTSTTFSGTIAGDGQFGHLGTGTTTLAGSNNSHLATNIGGGGAIAGPYINDRTNNSSFGKGNFGISDGSRLIYTGVSASTNRDISLGGVFGGVEVEQVGTTLTWTGEIHGASQFRKFGPGTLVLTDGDSSYNGGTEIVGGVLSIPTIADQGVNSPIGRSSIGVAGTLRYTGGSASTNRNWQMRSGGGTLDVQNAATTLTLSGNIDGPGGLTKTGAGTLALNANAAWLGATTVHQGTLLSGLAGVIPDGSAVTVNGGATWNLDGKIETI
ncbi:MAG TPA: autotransporter-associated beta strand repeat-containing protein, partial [Lacipirellulaceae bacterium]|nr:autotransporter-associated beta strand repeat-containing protein [Lacipirellulaceae bacterium]